MIFNTVDDIDMLRWSSYRVSLRRMALAMALAMASAAK